MRFRIVYGFHCLCVFRFRTQKNNETATPRRARGVRGGEMRDVESSFLARCPNAIECVLRRAPRCLARGHRDAARDAPAAAHRPTLMRLASSASSVYLEMTWHVMISRADH